MKKKVFLLVSILMATSISIIGYSKASASECSVQNPCLSYVFNNPIQTAPAPAPASNDPGTWAVVDNSGKVVNIIVCQPSVCGGGGTLGGQLNGDRLVQQTTTLSGQTSSSNQTVTEDNGTFTVDRSIPVVSEIITNSEKNTQSVITATRREVFTFNVDNSQSPVMNNNIQAEVKAEEVSNNVIIKTETNLFVERLTANQVKEELESKNLLLLLDKISIVISLLGSWIK